jgi:hypothetical protein
VNADDSFGLHQAPRDLDVFSAWPRVSRPVVMNNNRSNRAERDSVSQPGFSALTQVVSIELDRFHLGNFSDEWGVKGSRSGS